MLESQKENQQFYSRALGKHIELEFSDRKTISLIVFPNLQIKLKASLGTSFETLEHFLSRKRIWVNKQIKYFQPFQKVEQVQRNFISGQTLYYLGRQYKLKIQKVNSKLEEGMKLLNGCLYLFTVYPDNQERIGNILNKWFLEKAKIKLSSIFNLTYQKFKGAKLPAPSISIKSLKKSWGICKGNKISLNRKLIHFSPSCIEYVAFHELCHLVYKNHGKGFTSLLSKNAINWKVNKQKLEVQLQEINIPLENKTSNTNQDTEV